MISYSSKLISKDIDFLYSGNSSYDSMIQKLMITIKKNEDIVNKHMTSLKKVMENKRKLDEEFKPIRPFIANYFKNK